MVREISAPAPDSSSALTEREVLRLLTKGIST
jgi:hypothetical protein